MRQGRALYVRNSDTDPEDPSLGLWLSSVEAAGHSSLWLASLPAPVHRADGLCTKTAKCPCAGHKFVGCQDPPVPPGGAQWELNSEPVSALGSPTPASLRPCWEAQEGAQPRSAGLPRPTGLLQQDSQEVPFTHAHGQPLVAQKASSVSARPCGVWGTGT